MKTKDSERLCDKCGKMVDYYIGPINGIGGDDNAFGDGFPFTIDLCERCLYKMVKRGYRKLEVTLSVVVLMSDSTKVFFDAPDATRETIMKHVNAWPGHDKSTWDDVWDVCWSER